MRPEKILVRGVNWLGDAVMSIPALQRLREARPEAHVTLLTPRKLADLWGHHPALDEVIEADERVGLVGMARRIREGRYDVALVLPNSPRSTLEVFWAGVPQRIGYARPWRNWLLTRRVPPRPEEIKMRKRSKAEINRLTDGRGRPAAKDAISDRAHHVFQYLHLAGVLGASTVPLPPRLWVAEDEVAEIKTRWAGTASAGTPWFGLIAGAEYGPAKRWPVARFVEAALAIQRKTRCGWLIFGGPGDRGLAEEIAGAFRTGSGGPICNLAGQTSLRQLCAGLKSCRLVLTNDTGPMHVAAAVGAPVVALFGSTSPAWTGPGDPAAAFRPHHLLRAGVPCAPCFLRQCPIDFRCMNEISVGQVVQTVLSAAA
jgi:lipopolysaccharide heptosyltransferase II